MNRRDVLKLGGAAYLAAQLPRARASTPVSPTPRRLLIVFASGAWDTTYALDPKEPTYADVPAGAVQMFGNLDVFCDASRPNVTGFFSKYAALTSIVRGVSTDAINHVECQRRMATGTREESHADLGAIVAHSLGNDLPIPYLILGDIAYAGAYAVSSARVGTTNQIVDLIGGGNARSAAAIGVAKPDGPSDAEAALLRAYAQASVDRAHATRGATGYNRHRADDFLEAIDRGAKLRALGGGFGARGETTSFTQQVAIALDALGQDLSQTVMLDTRQPWDTHADNFMQTQCHEATFAGMTALLDGLTTRPGRAAGSKMIDDTVVVCISEMARTPRLSGTAGHEGKAHWPVTTELVIGSGVAGGRVVGSSTPDMQAVAVDLTTGQPSTTGIQPMYSHFVAGVLGLCGVDPAAYLPVTAYDAFVA